MSNVKTLLDERLKKGDRSAKIAALAKQSADGNLTSFAGVFSVSDLSNQEKKALEEMLNEYANGDQNVETDLLSLIAITSEVKAINNQAALLHGERIKKAQKILTQYKDGAFTTWLLTTYGNRQTPYNFLQYYEFWEGMPKGLRPLIETMPRQAIYTLASREGNPEKKQEIVANYKGQTKEELLQLIRDFFPLAVKDRRRQNFGESAITTLQRACWLLERNQSKLTKSQKTIISEILKALTSLIQN